ncbi:MAG: hypothetical protein GWP09_00175 [Nitrospiraceae bacterium]|nr:hypothetical protein [Nitrospiraceae bacterium]
MKSRLNDALVKAGLGIWKVTPLLIATLMLVSLITVFIPKSFYVKVFGRNELYNSFIGSSVGSVSAGNPVTSYILGGELLKDGISLIAVTAFLVAWVTVGLIQLPAEAGILGKRFALYRNISSFVLSMVVALITVFVVGVL